MGNDNTTKRIEIDLSNIRAKKYHDEDNHENHILLDKYYEKIVDLISDRIDEIDKYKLMNFDIDNINEVKMHDAILIYGSRGNGKSTVMINLEDFITGKHKVSNATKLDKKVKIFETIDPTIQEEDEDFLLVILSAILKEVEGHHEHKFTKRDAFYDSLENVLKIVEATRSKKKDDIDIFDKFYGLKSGVGLAEELHKLFKHTKEIFDVEILVIPIDDVDMNLKQGYQIADSIRKYMSSPYIIPIVAFNIRQMRVVTKYNKYKQFGLDIDKELELEELSFLRSLPNDYLSKIFPPNRRIYLKNVFEILKESTVFEKFDNTAEKEQENEKKNKDQKEQNYEIIFSLKNENNTTVQLKAIDMVSLISELFYETYYDEQGFNDIYVSTFLTNRSMRNFLNDCYCVLSSLSEKSEKIDEKTEKIYYKIERKVIKNRLAPDDIYAFATKKHALTWLWNQYIEVAKKNLISKNDILKNYNWARMVTETLPEDNSSEIINKKTYARIWLQKYYRKKEKICRSEITNDNNREFVLEKVCDIAGVLELAMRSYIPMYLFEHIVRSHNLEYDNSDLIYLKSFASRSLQGIAYELSMMEATLAKVKKESTFHPKPIGSVIVFEKYKTCHNAKGKSCQYDISDKELNIPYLFKVANQDKILDESKISDSRKNEQVYIMSFFKSLALFIELAKVYKNKNKKQDQDMTEEERTKTDILALIEKFRVNMPTENDAMEMKNDYYNEILAQYRTSPIQDDKDILNVTFKGSSFGILEIATFSKRLVDFFMNVRDNIGEKSLINFNEEKFDCNKNQEEFDFHTPIITYFTSFAQALFISLFHSVTSDNVLSIKSYKKDNDEIIFRKNSLYGTKKNESSIDHLYENNITNLKRISDENKKHDKDFNVIQNDFKELFDYINNEIPFFDFLINEANFLKELQNLKECEQHNASD